MTLVPPNSRDNFGTYVTVGPTASGDTTGVTDTAGVQAAINTANSGTVVLAAGTYYVTNLTQPTGAGSIRLIGSGPDRTFLRAASGATGILLDLSPASAVPSMSVQSLSINLTDAPTMTGLRTQQANRLYLHDLNIRYGGIGWQHVMTSGTGPFTSSQVNFQNQTSEAINLTGSTGNGSAGRIENSLIQVTDTAVDMTQGVLVNYFTTGVMFDNVQVLSNNASNLDINSGIVYTTAAPAGAQGAFLFFNETVCDGMSTGNALDLTNARGIWAGQSFFSTLASASKDGVAITGGKEQWYVGSEISGRGMSFASAPDKITVGSGCVFPQTATGGALIMPGANPPTNLYVAPDVVFYTSVTNDVPKLITATNYGYGFGRAGSYS